MSEGPEEEFTKQAVKPFAGLDDARLHGRQDHDDRPHTDTTDGGEQQRGKKPRPSVRGFGHEGRVQPMEAGLTGVGMACTAGRTFSANSRRLFSALARGIPP